MPIRFPRVLESHGVLFGIMPAANGRIMAGRRRHAEVTIVLVNEGYASTAVGPIEDIRSAGKDGGTEMERRRCLRPRFRVDHGLIDGRRWKSAYGLRHSPRTRAFNRSGRPIFVLSRLRPSEWMQRHAKLLPFGLVERYGRQGAMLGRAFARRGLPRRGGSPSTGVGPPPIGAWRRVPAARYPKVDLPSRHANHRRRPRTVLRRRRSTRRPTSASTCRTFFAGGRSRFSAPKALLLRHCRACTSPDMRSCPVSRPHCGFSDAQVGGVPARELPGATSRSRSWPASQE